MSFQWIFDNATNISVNTQPIVAQTVTRSGITRAVNRGGQPWVFDVNLPSGPRWDEYRPYLSAIERFDRHTEDTVQFNHTGQEYLFAYQGDMTSITNTTANWTQGFDTISIGGTDRSTATNYYFRAGDFVQLGTSGSVYKVVTDAIPPNTSGIKLHRPIREATSEAEPIRIGENCVFTLRLTQIPRWRVFGYNQVEFEGSFQFVEVIE